TEFVPSTAAASAGDSQCRPRLVAFRCRRSVRTVPRCWFGANGKSSPGGRRPAGQARRDGPSLIEGTSHPTTAAVEDVSVDHGGGDVLGAVAQMLKPYNLAALLQEGLDGRELPPRPAVRLPPGQIRDTMERGMGVRRETDSI